MAIAITAGAAPRGARPGGEILRLADGIELIGESVGSGVKEPPLLARRADGLDVRHPRYFYPPRVLRGWYGHFYRWSVRRAFREAVAEFCKGKIAHYKVPRYVQVVSEFPMTVTGKVQKFRMREISIAEERLEDAAQVETA